MKIIKKRFWIFYLFLMPYILLLAFSLYRGNVIMIMAALLVGMSGLYIEIQLFGRVVTKINEIQERYTLSVPDEVANNYVEYLCFILNMVDHTLDVEYSNQLMRKQAEFDSMKSQINPHFLYNTLDSIRGYALMEKAPIAADMIEILSRIFRYTISQKNDMIMIREELAMAKDYLAIQRYRVSNHVALQLSVDEENDSLLDYEVPKLIIQPFIENAMKHGMKDHVSDFHIDIDISTTGEKLIISINDDGCGMTSEQLVHLNEKLYSNEYGKSGASVKSKHGSGIAVVNVNARIKLLYGDSYGVIAYSTQGLGTSFQLTIPYKKGKEDEKGNFEN